MNIQPNSKEAEMAVIGSVIVNPSCFREIDLAPDDFYYGQAKEIWQAYQFLASNHTEIDYLTVTAKAPGCQPFLTDAIQKTPSSMNWESYVSIVKDKAKRRKYIQIAGELATTAYNEDKSLDAELPGFITKMVSNASTQRESEHVSKTLSTLYDDIQKRIENPQEIYGLPTGIQGLDKITGGMQKGEVFLLSGEPGLGKCLGKGTRILMFNGCLKNVEDISVGDLVMGVDSNPRTVLSLATGISQMYWIRQKHGIDYRVNGDHILAMKRSKEWRGYKHGEIKLITTREAYDESPAFFNNWKGFKGEVEFVEKDLPIDPYFLGLWLGDGCSYNSSVCSADKEIVDYFYEYAKTRGESVHIGDLDKSAPDYRITGGRTQKARNNSIQKKLRDLGVISNKHIPNSYLINSRKNRLLLLAGLVDSDGYKAKNSGEIYEITLANETLARQVKFLLDTLGFRTSFREKISVYKNLPYHCWRINFNGNTNEIPIRVERKVGRKWTSPIDYKVTGISIERDSVDKYYGFNLDGDGLFFLEDMTVTHNSRLAMQIGFAMAKFGKAGVIYEMEMSRHQTIRRTLSVESGVQVSSMKSGKIEDHEHLKLNAAINRLEQLPVYFSDSTSWTTASMRADLVKRKTLNKIEWFIVDYLRLLKDRYGKDDHERLAYIGSSLHDIAKDLNLAGLVIHSMNKQGIGGNAGMASLSGSGQISYDVDTIAVMQKDSKNPNLVTLLFDKLREGDGDARIITLSKKQGFPCFGEVAR